MSRTAVILGGEAIRGPGTQAWGAPEDKHREAPACRGLSAAGMEGREMAMVMTMPMATMLSAHPIHTVTAHPAGIPIGLGLEMRAAGSRGKVTRLGSQASGAGEAGLGSKLVSH